MPIRVLIVDDHVVVRTGIRATLEKTSDIQVVGEAQNGQEALRAVQQHKPDIVVMDVELPELNGIEATEQILQRHTAKVIALSAFNNVRYVRRMLKAGAAGYLLKSCALNELVVALRTVHQGRHYLSPQLTQLVFRDYVKRLPSSEEQLAGLTLKEREVLQLIAEGKSTAEIAEHLLLSTSTIATHRAHIMDKLGLTSVADLVKFAIREGLTSVHL